MLRALGWRVNTPTTHTFLSVYKQARCAAAGGSGEGGGGWGGGGWGGWGAQACFAEGREGARACLLCALPGAPHLDSGPRRALTRLLSSLSLFPCFI